MSNCPSNQDLARFTEGRLVDSEANRIRQHLGVCPACSEAVAAVMHVLDFEGLGLLPEVTVAEQTSAVKAIAPKVAPFGNNRAPMVGGEGGPSRTKTIEMFFGAAAAAGVASMVSPNTVVPAPPSGGDGKENDPLGVRNPSTDDSELGKGTHSWDADLFGKIPLQGGTMQSSINDFFGNHKGFGHEAPELIGQPASPGELSLDVKQAYDDSCGVRCQELILRDFGLPVTQTGLVQEAAAKGWYVPGEGMADSDLGKLLESHGVAVHRYENGNIFSLVNELAQGHRVIISVDSGELWGSNEVLKPVAALYGERWEDWRPDHAVIVSGVDVSDPARPVVVVTDPGTGEVAARYTLPDFMDAWADSGYSMVATNSAPAQFPMDHLPSIGQMPYEDFARLVPVTEGLTGKEPGFFSLCADFRQMVHATGDTIHQHVNALLTGEHGVLGHHEDTHLPFDHHLGASEHQIDSDNND